MVLYTYILLNDYNQVNTSIPSHIYLSFGVMRAVMSYCLSKFQLCSKT